MPDNPSTAGTDVRLRDLLARLPLLIAHLPLPGSVISVGSVQSQPSLVTITPIAPGDGPSAQILLDATAEAVESMVTFEADELLIVLVTGTDPDAGTLSRWEAVARSMADTADDSGITGAVVVRVDDCAAAEPGYTVLRDPSGSLSPHGGFTHWADHPQAVHAVAQGKISSPGASLGTGIWAPGPVGSALEPVAAFDLSVPGRRAGFPRMIETMVDEFDRIGPSGPLCSDDRLLAAVASTLTDVVGYQGLIEACVHRPAAAYPFCAHLASRVRGPVRSRLLGAGAVLAMLADRPDEVGKALISTKDITTSTGLEPFGDMAQAWLAGLTTPQRLTEIIGIPGVVVPPSPAPTEDRPSSVDPLLSRHGATVFDEAPAGLAEALERSIFRDGPPPPR